MPDEVTVSVIVVVGIALKVVHDGALRQGVRLTSAEEVTQDKEASGCAGGGQHRSRQRQQPAARCQPLPRQRRGEGGGGGGLSGVQPAPALSPRGRTRKKMLCGAISRLDSAAGPAALRELWSSTFKTGSGGTVVQS